MKSKLLIAVSLLSLGLVSCGGGGGSSSTPTPIVTTPSPTPTPSTTASPFVVVNTAESSAEEGQVLTLDGSQTSDSDSNASDLSFSWTQLTGSPATIVSPAEAVTEIFAAEVTADEVATFQLSVSDGENTASETIDLTFTNVFQSPRASVSFSTSQLTQSVPTASEIIIDTIGDSEFNSIFVKPQGSDLLKIASSYEPGDTAIADEVDNVALALTRAEVTSARDTTGRTVLYAASVFLDRVDAFTLDTFSSEFNESSGGYFISSPCDITDITGGAFQVSVRGVDNFSNINIVGQTNGGFEIVGTNFENSSNSILIVKPSICSLTLRSVPMGALSLPLVNLQTRNMNLPRLFQFYRQVNPASRLSVPSALRLPAGKQPCWFFCQMETISVSIELSSCLSWPLRTMAQPDQMISRSPEQSCHGTGACQKMPLSR